jgi:hypothetical protein
VGVGVAALVSLTVSPMTRSLRAKTGDRQQVREVSVSHHSNPLPFLPCSKKRFSMKHGKPCGKQSCALTGSSVS